MDWLNDDGGRADAGFKGKTGDCVTRSIAIATGLPYRDVYDELTVRLQAAKARARKGSRLAGHSSSSVRDGVPREVYEPFLLEHGWLWVAAMRPGTGTTVHLRADELPSGPLVVRVSKHMTAVIDGVIHDNHDPSRDGTRCVYGWFHPGANARTRTETVEES